MAFLPTSPLVTSHHTTILKQPRRPRLPLQPRHPICASQPPSPSPSSPPPSSAPSVAPIPSSLANAASQAIQASESAFQATRRLFIEVDLTSGDATYTLLKSSLPFVKLLSPLFPSATRTHIVLPDAGAAALARRDWDEIPPDVILCGLEQAEIDVVNDGMVVVVTPRASDVDLLVQVVESAGELPVIIVNPDLVDMGVTGLSLNARRLREQLIDTFTTSYFLKTFDWGVLLRAYPGQWGVWVDDSSNDVGFRLVGELDARPSLEKVDEVLRSDGQGEAGGGLFGGLARFLKAYMKG